MGDTVPSLTIKDIPEELLVQLRKSAAVHRHSLNREVLVRLEHSLGRVRIDPDAFLARVSALQHRTRLPPLTDEILERAINNEVRP